jgi:hypothetical protein
MSPVLERFSLAGKAVAIPGASSGLARGFALASDASSCVTGVTLAVDGGMPGH